MRSSNRWVYMTIDVFSAQSAISTHLFYIIEVRCRLCEELMTSGLIDESILGLTAVIYRPVNYRNLPGFLDYRYRYLSQNYRNLPFLNKCDFWPHIIIQFFKKSTKNSKEFLNFFSKVEYESLKKAYFINSRCRVG